MNDQVLETLALALTILASVVGIILVWLPAARKKPRRYLRKARAALQIVFLWVRGKQYRQRE